MDTNEMTTGELHARLEMLMRVWGVENGDASFEVRFDGCSDHAWSIVKLSDEGGGGDGDEDTETMYVSTVTYREFSGPTFADAVVAAWEHAGCPIECSECEGVGEFPATVAQQAEAVAAGVRLSCHIRGLGNERTEILMAICSTCNGEGYTHA